jgi:hypothetical protein
MQYLNDTVDAVTRMPVNTVIGAVFLALVLAAPVGLIAVAGRRRGKDVSMTLVAIATAANFLGMIVAVGQARHADQNPNAEWARAPVDSVGRPQQEPVPTRALQLPSATRMSDYIATRITPVLFSEWDTNDDKQLVASEAAAGAAAFIKASGSDKSDSVSEDELRTKIADAIEPHLRTVRQGPPVPVKP